MNSLLCGPPLSAALTSAQWPLTPPTRRWSVGLTLVTAHAVLALLLLQAWVGPQPLPKPQARALTWVHLAANEPQQNTLTAQSSTPVKAASHHERVTPGPAPFSAQDVPLSAPPASDIPTPTSRRDAINTTTASEPLAPALSSTGSSTPAPRTPSPAMASPKELPSSALRYVVAPAQVYPLRSQRLGEQGTVWLRLVVNAEGLPIAVSVARSSGHARLDEQAVTAMRAARFAPHIENGQALEWTALAPLTYELE